MVPDDDLNTKLKFHVSRYHIFFEKWKGAQNETATSIGIYKNWERGKLGKHSDPIKLCFYIIEFTNISFSFIVWKYCGGYGWASNDSAHWWEKFTHVKT